MDEVTLVDLDMGTCEPSPGSPRDDARLLPWSDRLQAALQVPTTLHSTANVLFNSASCCQQLAPRLAASSTCYMIHHLCMSCENHRQLSSTANSRPS